MCSLRFENNFLTDGCVCFASKIIFFLANVLANEKIKHSRIWSCFYRISLSSIALCQLFMAFLGNVGLVLLIKSLCVLNVAFRVHQNCVYMKIFKYPPIHYTDILQKMKTL